MTIEQLRNFCEYKIAAFIEDSDGLVEGKRSRRRGGRCPVDAGQEEDHLDHLDHRHHRHHHCQRDQNKRQTDSRTRALTRIERHTHTG